MYFVRDRAFVRRTVSVVNDRFAMNGPWRRVNFPLMLICFTFASSNHEAVIRYLGCFYYANSKLMWKAPTYKKNPPLEDSYSRHGFIKAVSIWRVVVPVSNIGQGRI